MPMGNQPSLSVIATKISRSAERHTEEILKGTAVTFLLRLLGTGIAFAFNLAVARLLGASGSGIFFLGTTTLTFSILIGRLGLDNVIVRYISAYASSGEVSALRGIFRDGALLSLGASGLVALALWGSSSWLAVSVFKEPHLESVLQHMALAVVPACFLLHFAAALRGLSRVGWATLVQPHQGGILVPAVSLCGLLIVGQALDTTIASRIYLAAFVGAVIAAAVIWRLIAPESNSGASPRRLRFLLARGIHLLWVSLANTAIAWIPIVLLGVFGTSTDVGVFTISFRTAALTSFVLIAVNSIAAPKFATMYAEGKMDDLRSVVKTSTRLLAAASVPILLILLVAPGTILSLFGDEFGASGEGVLRILAVGQFVNALTGSVNYLLMMTGRDILLRNIMVVGAAGSLVLNLILIPLSGMVGAALATTLTLAGINLYLVHILRVHYAFGR